MTLQTQLRSRRARDRWPHARGSALLPAAAAGAAAPSAEVVAVRRATLPERSRRRGVAAMRRCTPRRCSSRTWSSRGCWSRRRPKVQVRALTDGKRIAFRLEWADATVDDLPGVGALLRRVRRAAAGEHRGRRAGAADGRAASGRSRSPTGAPSGRRWSTAAQDTIKALYPERHGRSLPVRSRVAAAGLARRSARWRCATRRRARWATTWRGRASGRCRTWSPKGPGTHPPGAGDRARRARRAHGDRAGRSCSSRPLPDGLDAGQPHAGGVRRVAGRAPGGRRAQDALGVGAVAAPEVQRDSRARERRTGGDHGTQEGIHDADR